jgi:hypothetical protein
MNRRDLAVKLSHDEALVLFAWLSRTNEATNDFADLTEDQAEQRAAPTAEADPRSGSTAGLRRLLRGQPIRPTHAALTDRPDQASPVRDSYDHHGLRLDRRFGYFCAGESSTSWTTSSA